MCEPSHYILRTDRDECLGYGLIERLPRSLSSLPHQVLYLREGLFYEVEVRRGVRWQEHQLAAPNFHELPHPFRPVRPQSPSSTTTSPSTRLGARAFSPRKPRRALCR